MAPRRLPRNAARDEVPRVAARWAREPAEATAGAAFGVARFLPGDTLPPPIRVPPAAASPLSRPVLPVLIDVEN